MVSQALNIHKSHVSESRPRIRSWAESCVTVTPKCYSTEGGFVRRILYETEKCRWKSRCGRQVKLSGTDHTDVQLALVVMFYRVQSVVTCWWESARHGSTTVNTWPWCGWVRLAIRPGINLRSFQRSSIFCFTCFSMHVISKGGRNCPSGTWARPSLLPLTPIKLST